MIEIQEPPVKPKVEDIDPSLIEMRQRFTRKHGMYPPFNPL